jgi:hypothetical protein
MKKLLGVIVVGALAVAAFGSEADVQAIKAIHGKFEKAFVSNDSKLVKTLIQKYFAPDFMHDMKNGQSENRDQFMRNMGMAGMKFLAFKFTYGKASQSGNTITLPVTVTMKAQVKDAQGKPQMINNTDSDVETWVKKGTTWQMRRMMSTKRD